MRLDLHQLPGAAEPRQADLQDAEPGWPGSSLTHHCRSPPPPPAAGCSAPLSLLVISEGTGGILAHKSSCPHRLTVYCQRATQLTACMGPHTAHRTPPTAGRPREPGRVQLVAVHRRGRELRVPGHRNPQDGQIRRGTATSTLIQTLSHKPFSNQLYIPPCTHACDVVCLVPWLGPGC